MQPGEFTRQEILSQPEAWSEAMKVLDGRRREVADLEPGRRFDQVLFIGAGSTYYLSMAAAALTQELCAFPARAVPASELWLHPSSNALPARTLLVAISRSGETTETLRACQAFLADRRGELLTLSCYPESPLATLGALNLVLPSGQERSVAQTRAFTSLYLATVALAARWSGRDDLNASLPRLPQVAQRLLHEYASLAADHGRDLDLDRFFVLGSGPRYGLACELSLKLKEMTLSHSEPFHFLEFRHGPKSMVTPSTLLIALRSEVHALHEAAVLQEMEALGARILSLGEAGTSVRFGSGLPEPIRNVLYLPVIQWMAFERALAKGLDPDRPHHLDAVVRL